MKTLKQIDSTIDNWRKNIFLAIHPELVETTPCVVQTNSYIEHIKHGIVRHITSKSVN